MPPAAPPSPAQGDPAPGPLLPPPDPPAAPDGAATAFVTAEVRFVARVRIYAGTLGVFEPGDEIPEAVAADGLRAGVHFDYVVV